MTMLPSVFGDNLFDAFDYFDKVFNTPMRTAEYPRKETHLMRTDVRETENDYIVDIDLPGYKKDEISIQLEKGYLTISAAKTAEKEDSGNGSYIRRERYMGACKRTFFVGENVKKENISAKLEDGILRLTFPKKLPKEIEESRTIAID